MYPNLVTPLQLVERWIDRCKELEIPISEDVSVVNILADSYEIRQWNATGPVSYTHLTLPTNREV